MLVLDQAGWHVAQALVVPGNVTLALLPPYSPELNPVERVWLYLRERHLSHRVLASYDAIVDAVCHAWNQLTPERIHAGPARSAIGIGHRSTPLCLSQYIRSRRCWFGHR